MTPDELRIGVQVGSGAPGVTPVAFVAFVEVIDPDGERQVVRVQSTGISDARAERIFTDGQATP